MNIIHKLSQHLSNLTPIITTIGFLITIYKSLEKDREKNRESMRSLFNFFFQCILWIFWLTLPFLWLKMIRILNYSKLHPYFFTLLNQLNNILYIVFMPILISSIIIIWSLVAYTNMGYKGDILFKNKYNGTKVVQYNNDFLDEESLNKKHEINIIDKNFIKFEYKNTPNRYKRFEKLYKSLTESTMIGVTSLLSFSFLLSLFYFFLMINLNKIKTIFLKLHLLIPIIITIILLTVLSIITLIIFYYKHRKEH